MDTNRYKKLDSASNTNKFSKLPSAKKATVGSKDIGMLKKKLMTKKKSLFSMSKPEDENVGTITNSPSGWFKQIQPGKRLKGSK